MRQSRFLFICVMFFAVILLFCSQYNTQNPISSAYHGNYAFDIKHSLPDNIVLDSLEIFTLYKLPISHGTDTFAFYNVTPECIPFIDTALLVHTSSRDTLALMFVRPCTTAVVIRAVRPNGATVNDTLSVTVTNPFRIAAASNAAAGETVRCSIGRMDTRTIAPACSVLWNYSVIADTLQAHEQFSVMSIVPSSIPVSAKLKRTGCSPFVLQLCTITFGGSNPPYIYPPTPDVSLFINTTIMLRTHGNRASNQSAITKYVWRLGSIDTVTTTDSLRFVAQTTANALNSSVRCISAANDTSAIDSFMITIRQGTPVLEASAVSTDAVFINDSITVTATFLDTNGYVKRVVFSYATHSDTVVVTGADSIARTIRHSLAFISPGSQTVSVFAIDNDNFVSPSAPVVVSVRRGKPVVTAMAVDTPLTALFIGSTRHFTIAAHDTNGTIDTCAFDRNFNGIFEASERSFRDTIFSVLFAAADAGEKTCKVRVRDNDGVWSDTFSLAITVKPGPVVDSVRVVSGNAPYYTNDSIAFRVFFHDQYIVSPQIDSIYYSTNSGITMRRAAINDTIRFKIDTAFSGTLKLSVKIHDQSGVWSAEKIDSSVVILQGKPVATTISLPSTAWVGYANLFAVSATDINGTIVQYAFDRNLNGSFEAGEIHSADTFYGSFAITDAGSRTLRAQVQDDDGFWSDVKTTTVTVATGKPVINTITQLTSTTLYVNDPAHCAITSVSHTNPGNPTIDTIEIKKANSSPYRQAYAGGLFLVTFGLADSGEQIITIRVRDINGIWSEPKNDTITYIHCGRPRLIVPSSVTYIPVNGTTNTCALAIQSFDTNGTIGHSAYNWKINGIIYSSQDSIINNPDIAGIFNTPTMVTVTATDDDGFTAQDSFQVYFDGPPAKAVISEPINGTIWYSIYPTIVVTFKGGIDIRDGWYTHFEYRLRSKDPSNCFNAEQLMTTASASAYVSYTNRGTNPTDSITRYINIPFQPAVTALCGGRYPMLLYELYIRSVDTNGNFKDSDPVTIEIQ